MPNVSVQSGNLCRCSWEKGLFQIPRWNGVSFAECQTKTIAFSEGWQQAHVQSDVSRIRHAGTRTTASYSPQTSGENISFWRESGRMSISICCLAHVDPRVRCFGIICDVSDASITFQGPFRSSAETQRQRYKPFKPTLRVQTPFSSVEEARQNMKDQEWVARLHDDT